MRDNFLILISITALFSLAIGVGSAFNKSLPQNLTQTWKSNSQEQVSNKPQELESDTLKLFNSFIQPYVAIVTSKKFENISSNRDSMWWISADNWSILINKNVQSIGLVYPKAYDELSQSESLTSKIIDQTKSFFQTEGFLINTMNSSKSITDESFYDYIIAFQKGEERCVLTVNPDESTSLSRDGSTVTDPTIILSCSDNGFEQSYTEQIEFLKAINIRNAVVRVQKIHETAAKIGVNYRRTGHYALLISVNGQWKLIFSGQDVPDCKTMYANNFPMKAMEITCY